MSTTKDKSIKQWEDPESTSPLVKIEGKAGNEMEMRRESGLDKAAALSRTSFVPLVGVPQLPASGGSLELLMLFPTWRKPTMRKR